METLFQVYVVNVSSTVAQLAFSKDPWLVRLAIYDPRGRLVTRLDAYMAEVKRRRPGFRDVELLGLGEMIRFIEAPKTLRSAMIGPGEYQVEAILMSPPVGWWPADVYAMLSKEHLPIWGPGKVISPRQHIQLR
jgi:hypothetical protein